LIFDLGLLLRDAVGEYDLDSWIGLCARVFLVGEEVGVAIGESMVSLWLEEAISFRVTSAFLFSIDCNKSKDIQHVQNLIFITCLIFIIIITVYNIHCEYFVMLPDTYTINIYIFRHCHLKIFQGKSNGQFLSFIFIYMHYTLIFPFFSLRFGNNIHTHIYYIIYAVIYSHTV
jgi:hypothetical protein